MTILYLLGQETFALQERLQALLGPQRPIVKVDSQAALMEGLLDARQALVLNTLPQAALAELQERCRFACAGTVLLGLLPAADTSVLDSAPPDCRWLCLDGSDFEWRNTLLGALHQAALLDRLAESAQRDEVSNLYSRAYFMSRLTGELSLAKRHKACLALLVLGLDCYPIYLDSYGYQFVNALLRFLGDSLGGMIRHEDVLARIGDDEIAILLPQSTEAGAKTLAARMVQVLNAQVFHHGSDTEEVLVSAGVVAYPVPDSDCQDADTLLRYARHALYHTKADDDEASRVCLFSEIIPTL